MLGRSQFPDLLHLKESRAPNSQMAAMAYFHKDGLMQT